MLQWQGLSMNYKPHQIATIGNVSVIAVQIMTTMNALSKLDISYCYMKRNRGSGDHSEAAYSGE